MVDALVSSRETTMEAESADGLHHRDGGLM